MRVEKPMTTMNVNGLVIKTLGERWSMSLNKVEKKS